MTPDQRRAGIDALYALRDAMPATKLANEIHDIAKLPTDIDTYQRHIRGCFDPERNDFFKFWEVIVAMEITACHEPFFYLCDRLGYERPNKKCPSLARAQLSAEKAMHAQKIAEIDRQMAALPDDQDTAEVAIARFSRA